METKNIMIVGVGGQGTLLASKLLGRVLLGRGYDVKVSEVHGMSQRGGSVVTFVRYGGRVYSPVIDKGGADYILSFELLEAARWSEYLKRDGLIITNSRKIDPMPVITGAAAYPAGIEGRLRSLGLRLDAFDALSPALAAGSGKAVNLVLLGRLSRSMEFTREEWDAAIAAGVPGKFLEINQKAFALGAAETVETVETERSA